MADGDNKKNPLGPTGERLRANLADIRENVRGLTYKELSERLAAIGRVIPVLGLSRVEKGERRVDADDLVALAVALNVSPARLLLGGSDDELEEVPLTASVAVNAGLAWSWMRGDEPIPDGAASRDGALLWGGVIRDFQHHSLPAFEQRRRNEAWTAQNAATVVQERIRGVIDGREDGRSLRRALNRLVAEIDDLIGDDEDGR